jgi:hypothetical protein
MILEGFKEKSEALSFFRDILIDGLGISEEYLNRNYQLLEIDEKVVFRFYLLTVQS